MKKSNFVLQFIRNKFTPTHSPARESEASANRSIQRSADGFRSFRSDQDLGRTDLGIPHVHFEIRDPATGKITTNNRVRVLKKDGGHDHEARLH